MRMGLHSLAVVLAVLTATTLARTQPSQGYRLLDSGGPIMREQAAYDVLFYRLDITFDTLNRSISGTTLTRAVALDTLSTFVLDLETEFAATAATWKGRLNANASLSVTRIGGKIFIQLPFVVQRSDTITVELAYNGTPRVAVNPPWGNGFVWKRARTGELWVGVACEDEGGDIWWPCKDHPSDEPDSVALNFTGPSNLMCVSNGKLLGTVNNGNGTTTFQWYVGQPINNYNVTFYLGPYVRIPVDYTSVTGEKIPAEYWFLTYNVDSAKALIATWLKDVRFLEETCGPYPFRAEKYCIVDAPYAGMEHQSAVAYGVYGGYHFNPNFAGYGFDYIHLHEMAHEWWGNLVTAKDWSDLWIHEGFATYMEALFVEKFSGPARYRSYMARLSRSLNRPIAPILSVTAATAYSANVYGGGAWVLHSLRGVIGDSTFFRVFRRWAYPDPAMEMLTNGKQCRLATVEDFRQIAEQISGKDLAWFFTVYLRQAGLPQLTVERRDTTVTLRWKVTNNVSFPMPVEVQVGTTRSVVDMPSGSGTFSAPVGVTPTIDPDTKIMMATPLTVSVEEPRADVPGSFDVDVYPNPFNPSTTLLVNLPERQRVVGEIFTIEGARLRGVVDELLAAGSHRFTIDLAGESSGVYFVVVRAGDVSQTRRLALVR